MSDQAVISNNLDTPLSHLTSPAEAMTKDQKMSIIFEMARFLASQHDLETMFSEFLSWLVLNFGPADAGVLLLCDSSCERLVVEAAQGYDLDALRRIHLSPGEATSGRAFQNGRVELYPTAESIVAARANMTPDNQEMFAKATQGLKQPQSVISMPLITAQNKVGVLMLENRHQPISFAPADLPFLQDVAELIALRFSASSCRS
jgi:GAF domain-containing protein